MENFKKIEWKQVVVALAALGILSTSEPEAAILSIAAMVLVAILNLVAKATDRPIGRGWVSVLVYGVAFSMAVIANPPAAGLPIWAGDAAVYVGQLAVILADFGPYALALTGSATILYNALSKLVFERLEERILARG